MWIELDQNEVATILAATTEPSIVAKLKPTAPHPDADAFIEAADRFSDYLHVVLDPHFERTRNGAYVMPLLWVPNERAGFQELNDFREFDISEECRELLEAVHRFDVENLEVNDGTELGAGSLDGYRWTLGMDEDVLLFVILADEQSPPWSYKETYFDGLNELTDERCFRFLIDAIQHFRGRWAEL